MFNLSLMMINNFKNKIKRNKIKKTTKQKIINLFPNWWVARFFDLGTALGAAQKKEKNRFQNDNISSETVVQDAQFNSTISITYYRILCNYNRYIIGLDGIGGCGINLLFASW